MGGKPRTQAAKVSTWKPRDQLTASDFRTFAVWTFDRDRAEGDARADETWVRPLGVAGFDRVYNELFAAAWLSTSDGERELGCLVLSLFEYSRKPKRIRLVRLPEPRVQAVAVLDPHYLASPVVGTRAVAPPPEVQAVLPCTYESRFEAGGRRYHLQGKIR